MTRTEATIEREALLSYCDNTAGYEILAHLMTVNTDSMEVELIPRSRQEIHALVNADDRTMDRRLKEGHDELGILHAESGEGHEQYDDMRRVYRIVPGRITPELLREIKMKGYFRPRQPHSTVSHADVSGGDSTFFGPLPEWEEFVNEYL